MKFIPWPLYKQILETMPIPCVDIAIVTERGVLLVRRNDAPAKGAWWLPGGRVLKGEMMRDAALRKAREEVGIECHVGPIVHTAETIFSDGPGDVPIHSINSCFFMYPAASDLNVKLDEHHKDYKWVDTVPEGLDVYVERCLVGAGLIAQRT